ncbi:MAG: hypothetical protein Q9190_002960 [Brigantiaea leucoxantha]
MPRTFKFAFPLPGKKTPSEKDGGPISSNLSSDLYDDSPLSDPGSKAERVLGTSEPTRPNIAGKSSRRSLRNKPSFISVTISEADSDTAAGRDGFPFPGIPRSAEGSRRPSYNLRNQSSSPLLGERFAKGSPGTDSITTDSSSPRPHFYGSSSTLRSFYDSKKSPLSISQQTSASSARDGALRKGHPTASSPLSQDVSEKISPSSINESKRTGMHAEGSQGSRAAALDQSTMFPESYHRATPVLLPHEGSNPPSQISTTSNSQRSSSAGRTRWWKKWKAKETDNRDISYKEQNLPFDEGKLGLSNSGKDMMELRAGTPFGLDSVKANHNLSQSEYCENKTHETDTQCWSSAHDDLQKHFSRQDSRKHNGDQQKTIPPADIDHTIPPSETFNRRIEAGREIVTNVGCLSRYQSNSISLENLSTDGESGMNSLTTDIQNRSFLDVDTSEDESESSGIIVYPHRRHRIRDSIDQTAIGDEVLVYKAERIRPVKPKPVHTSSPRKFTRASEVIPPVPQIPQRPQLQKRVSSMRWRESVGIKSTISRVVNDSVSSGHTSIASQVSLGATALEPTKKKTGYGSKMMAVTVEEEELLEAMRKKRASIRQDAFTEGYAKAFRSNGSFKGRPRTAGADGSEVLCFGSGESTSPPPSLPKFPQPAVPSASSHTSDSSPPFSEASKRSKAPSVRFPPPKVSPTSSFSPSDILPSTPQSRLSPITPPPPGRDSLEIYVQGLTSSPSRAHHMAHKGRQERKRTMSSGIVMLDGAEHRAQELDNEDAITGWAMDRW